MKHEKNKGFWKAYKELVRTKVLPYQWAILNDRIDEADLSCCIRNFRVAAGDIREEFGGMVFQDSDVYKWIEAVAYSLEWCPDNELENEADKAISIICKAQLKDGYLNTYYIINGLDKRLTNLKDNHELYCLGHLIEAAVAYYESTGKSKLLDTAIKYVTYIDLIFGADSDKKIGYPGHEVLELALMKLYKVTGDIRHFRLAKFFIDERGRSPLFFEEETNKQGNDFSWEKSYYKYQYYQAGKEVRNQHVAEGHAVRAVYLYSGMADIAIMSDDKELFSVCEQLWENITQKQMYITGGIGASSYGESFTYDYDLPNDTAYAETCASIGLVFFGKRMFDYTRDSKYMDVIERSLYNGIISGISLDGESFFYVNPLEIVPESIEKDKLMEHVNMKRQPWFSCACCPPNLARIITSIDKYAYDLSEDTVFINLYMNGPIELVVNGKNVKLNVETSYPWEANITFRFELEEVTKFELALRLPSWSEKYSLLLNGVVAKSRFEKGYLYIERSWNDEDEISFNIMMEPVLYSAHPRVKEDYRKVALLRGPLVYCLEEIDNGKGLHLISVDQDTKWHVEHDDLVLGGISLIRGVGKIEDISMGTKTSLYNPHERIVSMDKPLTWVPYYSWANREQGEMLVWVNLI